MKIQKKFQAAVIGAGSIGAFFDNRTVKRILTHAHAYHSHPGFSLAAFIDTNKRRAQKAAQLWGGRAYGSISELFSNEVIDVVSVCVPDESHYTVLNELKDRPLKGGIIEKPLTGSPANSKKIADSTLFSRNPFLVNYTRRFDPKYQALRKKIQSGAFGKFVSGNAFYGKGLLHNGSHILDLLLFFGFEVERAEVHKRVFDFYRGDPTCAATLHVRGGGIFTMNMVPHSLYRVLEFDLLFEKGRVRAMQDCLLLEEFTPKKDKVFDGYTVLVQGKSTKIDPSGYLFSVVNNLYESLTGKNKPLSTVQDGYEVEKLCAMILKK